MCVPMFLNRMIKWYPSQWVISDPTIPCTGNCCIAFGRYCSDARCFYKWKERGLTWIRKVCRDGLFLIAHCCKWFTGQQGASLLHKSPGTICHFCCCSSLDRKKIIYIIELLNLWHIMVSYLLFFMLLRDLKVT